MRKKGESLLVLLAVTLFASLALSQEIRVVTPTKGNPLHFLPLLTAEERGFWKALGLSVEWQSLRSGREVDQGIAAGVVNMAITPSAASIISASRGVPILIVADLEGFQPWYVWVRADSPAQALADLRGARVGVTSLGRLAHAYGQVIVRSGGIEKEVRFVGVGGVREGVAALRTGAIDAFVQHYFALARLDYEGVARSVAALFDYVPKGWDPTVLFSTKKLIQDHPGVVKKMVQSVLEGGQFIMKNRGWAIEQMKKEMGLPEPAAQKVYSIISFSRDGKIHPERLSAIKEFLVKFGLLAREKAPPLEGLYTAKFVLEE